jgi:ABC-2 type transport system ATP-binding protein
LPVLTVRNITKIFGAVRAVDGISFSVRRGTITGLLGRNGAGKTTTIRMITGIFLPDSGSIDWEPDARSPQNRIGYLPEERGLYRQMKVIDELIFLAEIKGRSDSSVRKDIDRWLERFELTDKRDAKIEELSKGNQQKVQLIATLLHEPDLIILDEPQSGLDPVNMVLVRNLLQELKAEGRTILLSTHMMGEAERLADEIILVHRGQVVLEGTLEEVKSSSGKNTLRIDFDGDGSFLTTLPHVKKATMHNRSAELELVEGSDPQEVLKSSIGRIQIRKFELASPSLEEIFIERVGAQSAEVAVNS